MIMLLGVLITLIVIVWIAAVVSMRFRAGPLDLGFLGALIGAAGTIFAATIAYTAVQMQIDDARRQAAENAKLSEQFQKRQAESEMAGLKAGRKDLETVLDLFANAPPDSPRDRLITLWKGGKLPLNLPSPMVGNLMGRSQAFLQRLNSMAGQIQNMTFQMTPDVRAQSPDWRAADTNVSDAINDGKKIISDIEAEIDRREKELVSGGK